MKKLFLFATFLIIIHSNSFSQGCLPEGITFTTQEQIDNFQANYPGCTEIEGDVNIGEIGVSNDFTSLQGLDVITSISGNLWIVENSLINLDGLNNLEFIGGHFLIIDSDALTNLTGLEGLTYIGGLFGIAANNFMTNLTGLNNLSYIGDDLSIEGSTTMTSLVGIENLTSIGGDLKIMYHYALTSLSGLENLTSVGGDIDFKFNTVLPNLEGLENLTSIGGDLFIEYNDALTSLIGLDNITFIPGNIYIMGNPVLFGLDGLENLTYIGGSLEIWTNDNLHNLTGFENLTSIGGHLWINWNGTLSSLAGLENIHASSIQALVIVNNHFLSVCEVQGICKYLTVPYASIVIGNNAPGCNSPDEVEAACLTGVEENTYIAEISLSPNPATSFITITTPLGEVIEEAIIYNHLGQKALEASPVNNTVDVSTLKPGIYFLEIITSQSRIGTKLVIE